MKLPSYEQQLSALVATPSVSSAHPDLDTSNRPVLDILATWFQDLGFSVVYLPVPGEPDKANLLATLGQGDSGLVLSGHTDTVPYNAERWQQDPFKLTTRDERWYGLGATDMKGFFPVITEAVKGIKAEQLKQPIMVLATADEETSMSGARALAEIGQPKGRYAIIGEPTNLQPIRAHKGIMMESVRIQGLAGHSSNPKLGKNAMEAMHEVLAELLLFRKQMEAKYENASFAIKTPTLNLGYIHGGDNPNRICGHCELHFDLRPLPGMSLEDLRAEISQRLQPISEKFNTPLTFESLFPGVPAFEQPQNSTLVQAAHELTGQTPESVAFATEAPFLQGLGMETLVMGPGSIDQAHQPNEYIAMSQIDPAVAVLKGLIKKFCM